MSGSSSENDDAVCDFGDFDMANGPVDNQLMIPDWILNEVDAVKSFIRCFYSRYGKHPMFYSGTLAEAVKSALCVHPAMQRPIILYLHNDKSLYSNIVCSQCLCFDSIINFLNTNYVVWCWDLTSAQCASRFFENSCNVFGINFTNLIKRYYESGPNAFPLAVIFTSYNNGSRHNFFHYDGQEISSANDMIQKLIHCFDVFKEKNVAEVERFEIEQAYLESAREDERKEQLRIEQEEMEQREQMLKAALKQQALSRLKPEPDSQSQNDIVVIKFRLPGGETLTRKFLRVDSAQQILDFITAKGFDLHEYKVVQRYPKRDMSDESVKLKSLADLKLYSQETLFVELRDS